MATDLQFIDSVKLRPILWDSRLESYKQQELKNAIWKEVGGDLLTSGYLFIILFYVV